MISQPTEEGDTKYRSSAGKTSTREVNKKRDEAKLQSLKEAMIQDAARPVSYTHLDVYKRQL